MPSLTRPGRKRSCCWRRKTRKMNSAASGVPRRVTTAVVAAAALLIVFCSLTEMAERFGFSPPALAQDRGALVVRTQSGPVRGVHNGAVDAFLGIPYGAPTVGDKRWRPPEPAESWNDIREAKAFGVYCAATKSTTARDRKQKIASSSMCGGRRTFPPTPGYRSMCSSTGEGSSTAARTRLT